MAGPDSQEGDLRQLRQPRLAEIVASGLREDILSGRLKNGDRLGNQEALIEQYQVSPPALREAMRILETEGLITVQRGNVGGAIIHSPTPERAAQMIAMVLQSRATSPVEVSRALGYLEPICAGLCAERKDRDKKVVPLLREVVEKQRANIDDTDDYLEHSRTFHSEIVRLCGNEALIVVISSLQAIWAAHDTMVWRTFADGIDIEADPSSPLASRTRKAALRTHEKLVDAIESGSADKANRLAAAHIGAAHTNTLRTSAHKSVIAKLVDNPLSVR